MDLFLKRIVSLTSGCYSVLLSITPLGYISKKRVTIRYVLSAICYLLFNVSFAQTNRYGHEWINFSQTYFKISVGQTGLYRLNYADLQKVGFPLNTVDATTVQLYFRGQEQAIFVSGEADKKIDSPDFIEFYGQKNDGTLDSALYIPNTAQPHKTTNIYSDTTAYFLTWRLDGQAGKRMAFYQDANSTHLATEAHHRETLFVSNVFQQNYTGMSDGQVYPLGAPEGSQLSHYDVGEGWSGVELRKNILITKELSTENVVFQGAKPQLEVHLLGRDHRRHRVEVMVSNNPNGSRTVETALFDFFAPYIAKKEIDFTDISGGKLYITTASRGYEASQTDDVYSVSYYQLRYAQKIDFQNKNEKYFYLNPNNTGRSYVEIPNVTADVRLFDISDLNNVQRIGGNIESNTFKAIIRQTNVEKTLLATRNTLTAPIIEKVSFRNIDPTKHNYLIVTHTSLTKAVQNYAAYRAGTGYDTLMVTTDQLINQFNYGEFSPLAIRRFTQFMTERGSPRFMFLIGQTQQVNFNRNLPNRRSIDLVPTFGWPGSDNMFSQGLKGTPAFVPAIPTGRLWTNNPQTVLDYLDKVKQHEATPMNALWRKNVLHLSGGISTVEQSLFKKNLDEYKAKTQQPYLGARTTTITKKTDEAVEYVGISSEVNKGVGLITMFGHSGLNVTDIDVGFVTNDVQGYRNKGKYPLVYANGCVLGNFTFGEITYPMDWIAAKDRGAILFLSHANTAFTSTLKQYGDVFYEVYFNDSTNLGRPFGEVHQRIIQRFLKQNPNSPIHIADAQQMSLQGDPAVVMFPAKNPDYGINTSQISVLANNGGAPSALSDSLRVKVIVSNFGMYRPVRVPVRLVRIGRDGVAQTYNSFLPSVAYQDSIFINIPNDRSQASNNRFELTIDPNNTIAELNEQNNTATLELSIGASGAYPLMPTEFAVVSSIENAQSVATLVAQQVETLPQNYAFELDTTARFDSPFKRTQNVSATQLPSWKVTLLSRDSTTYYWRIRYADRPANDDNRWSESSFTHIRNANEGWAQRQAPQFLKNAPLQLSVSTTAMPVWTFTKAAVPIKAVLAGNSVGAFNEGFSKNQLIINDIVMVSNGGCASYDQANNWRRDNNIIVTALRRDNLRAYSVMPAFNCGNPPYAINTLPDRLIINEKLLEKWIDSVPNGDWIVMMTSGNVAFENWPSSSRAKLQTFGVTNARLAEIRSGRPYMFIGQKGAKQLAQELLTDPNDLAPSLRTVSLDNFMLQSTQGSGQVVSTLIGPASSWQSLQKNMIQNSTQQHNLDILGVDLNERETVLLQNQIANNLNLNQINANLYPFLKLRLNLSNSDINTSAPAQLRQWLVSYTAVAEGAATTTIAAAERQEGEVVNLSVGFKNVSNVAFRDSILMQQTLYLANGTVQQNQQKIKKLAPNEEVSFNLSLPTVGRVGQNRLVVNFNPKLQPEQNFTNNTLNIPITVTPDRIPPTMDVFFDNQRIKDADVVSASPTVLVQLKDENRVLFKRDTLGLDLFLQSPNQAAFRRISFANSSLLKFIPADNQNIAKIEYRPGTLADGLYTLRVQGADASGNRTGVYSVTFRVLNEQKILDVHAYPNPASELVSFSFVVSGKDAPSTAQLTITNAAGQLVKVLTQAVRVGTNLWPWPEARQMATGSYVYRLEVLQNGQPLPLAAETKLTGKVVIGR